MNVIMTQENDTQQPKRALIVIDVQNEYVTGDLQIEYPLVEDSLQNIGKAMDFARDAGIPVIVVQQMYPKNAPLFAEGTDGWQLHDVVASRPRDHFVQKKLSSAFVGTDLGDWLRQQGVDTLAVAGYMTHNCNDTTIKHAVDTGLAVEFLMDASGSVPYANCAGTATAEEIHRVFAVVEQSNFAAVLSTDEWLSCLAGGVQPERDNIHATHQRALLARQHAVA